jgi:hypothetical protein
MLKTLAAGLVVIGLVWSSPVAAQWRVTMALDREQYSSMAAGESEEAPELGYAQVRPWLPLIWSLRVDGPPIGSRFRAGVEVRHGIADLGINGGTLVVLDADGLLRIVGVAPVLSYRLLSHEATQLRAEFVPVVERWSLRDEGKNVSLALLGGLALEAPLGSAIGVVAGLRGGFNPIAPIDTEWVPFGLEPQSGWRWGVRLGLTVTP